MGEARKKKAFPPPTIALDRPAPVAVAVNPDVVLGSLQAEIGQRVGRCHILQARLTATEVALAAEQAKVAALIAKEPASS